MKHLWECDHPYYCSEENYFRGRSETVAEYDSWAGWLNLNLGMDVDYNLIFRWDWKPIDEDGGHPKDDAAMDILDDNPDCKIRRLMGLEAWAAKHNLLKPDGTPREIIGTLPVTADGVIVANQFETVYIVSQHGKVRESYLYHRGVSGAGSCYSTREAAERAAGGGA